MSQLGLILLCLASLASISCAVRPGNGVPTGQLVARRLTCMAQAEPDAVDVANPALSWALASPIAGDHQAAYRILVATQPDRLERGQADAWDSKKIFSQQNIRVPYEGEPLAPARKYYWKVQVWGADGRPGPWSPTSTFTTGLMAGDRWTGKWLVARDGQSGMPVFRKSFSLGKPVARATMLISGLGQYELHVNGHRAGRDEMTPGWTDYKDTVLYQSQDVTARLHEGSNVIGVLLGNGMYHIPPDKGRYRKFLGSFGAPCLIAELHVTFADGTGEVIGTDASWKTTTGPILFSSVYGGEDVDAAREPGGWDAPGFDDAGWSAAVEGAGPGGKLYGSSRSAPPVRVTHTFADTKVTRPKPGVIVYDFGQNASAIPEATLRGAAGAKVKFTPAEELNKEGLADQSVIGHPTYCTYSLAGGPEETWRPKFFYCGMRFLQVEGAVSEGEPNPENLPVIGKVRSHFITSASAPAGEFSCSSELFNATAGIIRWAMRSNMVSVLTDCPHRERLGWLEQNHLVGPSLMSNFDVQSLFGKACWDMADAQTADGLVPDIAPEFVVFKGGFRDSPEWGSAAVLVPWQLFQWYGDVGVLADHYSMMKRYVAYLDTKASGHLLSHGLGDWYDLGPKRLGQAQLTPTTLTATAFYYRDCEILSKVATILNKPEDAKLYAAKATEIRDAFNAKLYDPIKHTYATGSQTSNALPLVMGLAPEADRAAILASLVAEIRGRDNKLTSGDVGFRYLLRALADGGRSDVIFDMNSRSDRPGYGMILAKGNTTLTEGWDGSASKNHFMLGHIMEWFYSDLAGIKLDPADTGFRKIIVQPTPVGDITWAKASYECPNGLISSSWKLSGNAFSLDVVIPPNSTATVILPDGSASRVESGTHHFEARVASLVR